VAPPVPPLPDPDGLALLVDDVWGAEESVDDGVAEGGLPDASIAELSAEAPVNEPPPVEGNAGPVGAGAPETTTTWGSDTEPPHANTPAVRSARAAQVTLEAATLDSPGAFLLGGRCLSMASRPDLRASAMLMPVSVTWLTSERNSFCARLRAKCASASTVTICAPNGPWGPPAASLRQGLDENARGDVLWSASGLGARALRRPTPRIAGSTLSFGHGQHPLAKIGWPARGPLPGPPGITCVRGTLTTLTRPNGESLNHQRDGLPPVGRARAADRPVLELHCRSRHQAGNGRLGLQRGRGSDPRLAAIGAVLPFVRRAVTRRRGDDRRDPGDALRLGGEDARSTRGRPAEGDAGALDDRRAVRLLGVRDRLNVGPEGLEKRDERLALLVARGGGALGARERRRLGGLQVLIAASVGAGLGKDGLPVIRLTILGRTR
jgi:hypothetical protein